MSSSKSKCVRTEESQPLQAKKVDSEYIDIDKDVSKQTKRPQTVVEQCVSVLTASKLSLLLIFVPLSFFSYYLVWSSTWTFLFSCLALCPLAALLGDLTEDLALRYNETIGALLNASFGNATELIVSIFALKAGLYDVIKNSLAGSVLGNMMLVLGTAFLASGLRNSNVHDSVHFNMKACQTYCTLLLLAMMGMLIPTVMFFQTPGHEPYVLKTSRHISLLMIFGYVLYVIFQLVTHKAMFEPGQNSATTLRRGSTVLRSYSVAPVVDNDIDDDDEEDEPIYSATFATVSLCLCTILISFESEFLVDTLEPAARQCGLSNKFISVILLPIVGNAAEHSTAVTTAYKGKMDIALGVAIGSSIQISLFVVPMLVIISWCFNQPLGLNFEPFIVTLMLVSVLITKSIVEGGRSNWLSGAMLLLAYAMIAVALFNSYGPNGA